MPRAKSPVFSTINPKCNTCFVTPMVCLRRLAIPRLTRWELHPWESACPVRSRALFRILTIPPAHGFIYQNGIFTTVDAPDNLNGTWITGINMAGQIVGYYARFGQAHGFVAIG